MRGPGYYLVTDLLVAAGHTREQASAAVARIEFDVLDFAHGNVAANGPSAHSIARQVYKHSTRSSATRNSLLRTA
ncbi:hypothetical protein [Kitasatospora sp. NPDC088346]|uniref:hypothetical protein n=1 Tax=Kitasatospora sp. NPDC088346 TaxID=3364073 RepID=UPI0037F177FE